MATGLGPSISPSGFVDILPAPPAVSKEWASFSILLVDATPLRAKTAFADHALGLYTSGRHRISRQIGGRSVEGWSDPGAMNLTPAHLEGTWESTGTSRAVVLFIPDVFLSRVIAEHWERDPKHVEILPRFLERDRVIEAVLMNLAFEARNGCGSGELYVQSACEFIAHHLIHSHSSLSTSPERSVGGLPRRSLTAVVDYIEENLAQALTLRKLAEVARVSIRHFERAFRQSMKEPPHAYVLRQRIERARHLILTQRQLSVEEIAVRVGFSSGSHLASLFRRHTGHSPTAFRKLIDG